MKIKIIKNLAICAALLAVLVFAAACSDSGTRVASVNGINIYERDIAYLLSNAEESLMMDYLSLHAATTFNHDNYFFGGVTFGRAIREQAVRHAAFSALVREFAAEHDITISDEIAQSVHNYIDSRVLIEGLHPLQLQLMLLRVDGTEHLADILLGELLVDAVLEYIMNSPALFADFEHLMPEPRDYVTEFGLLGAKHILSSFTRFTDVEQTEIYIQYMYDRIQEGVDFSELMHEFSQDLGLEDFPYGYTFGPGDMVPEFEAATRELEIGEISGIIRTFHGFHIIKRVEPDPQAWALLHDRQLTTERDRMQAAVIFGFEEMIDNADIRFFRALDRVDIH